MRPVRKLLPIYLVIFFGYIGYSLIITIFTPLFLYHEGNLLPVGTPKEVRILALGLVIFLYPFGQFLSAPILGALSDRIGRRPVLLFSITISTIIYILIGFGVWWGRFWLVATALLIAGLSEGNTTIAQSAIADVSTKKERSKYFGYITFSASLSYVVGPLLSGKLANLLKDASVSFAIPFFVVACLLFATLIWLYFGFKESLVHHKRAKISYFEAFTNLKNLFFMRHMRFLFLVNFLIYLAMFGYFQSFPIYIVSRFQVDVWQLSIFIAWSAVPFLLVNLWLTGHFAKRFSAARITAYSAIWIGIFLQILLLPSQMNALWITLFLLGLGVAICLPASSALISSAAEEHEQGRVMGINQSLQFFAEAFSGLAMGFLAAIFVKLALIIFGLLSLVGAAFLIARSNHVEKF